VSRPKQIDNGSISSVRQAAAACDVTPPVVRRWLSLGLLTEPPWTLQQLHQIRDETDPEGRRRGPQVLHGTLTRWLEGCDCDQCREAQTDAARARFRRKAQERFPADVRQQLLDAIYGGRAFRTVLRELGLTSNQVWSRKNSSATDSTDARSGSGSENGQPRRPPVTGPVTVVFVGINAGLSIPVRLKRTLPPKAGASPCGSSSRQG
jgi:hypothetical protein